MYIASIAHLSSFVQVDEAPPEVVRVPVANERQIFEEYAHIRHTGSGRHPQALPVPLVVTLWNNQKIKWYS